jgi:zinc protease
VKKFLLGSFLVLSSITNLNFAQSATPRQAAATNAPAKGQDDVKVPFVNRTLANGLEVIVLPDASVPLVTVEMAVRNGSFTEPPELNGLSHLYEHMFFKSNKAVAVFRCDLAKSYGNLNYYMNQNCGEQVKLKAQIGDVGYLNELDKLGYVRNGTTQEEYVNYYFSTTSPNLATMMRFMRDAMLFPSFDEEEFRQEIQVVLGELDRQMSEPGYYLDRTLMDKLFYKYPSRKSPGGTRETVAAATTEKMRSFNRVITCRTTPRSSSPATFSPEQVFKLAEQLFGIWKKGEDPFVKFPLSNIRRSKKAKA